jgi:hypothetical protein
LKNLKQTTVHPRVAGIAELVSMPPFALRNCNTNLSAKFERFSETD